MKKDCTLTNINGIKFSFLSNYSIKELEELRDRVQSTLLIRYKKKKKKALKDLVKQGVKIFIWEDFDEGYVRNGNLIAGLYLGRRPECELIKLIKNKNKFIAYHKKNGGPYPTKQAQIKAIKSYFFDILGVNVPIQFH